MEQLIAILNMIAPMSAALEAHLRTIIKEIVYEKGDIILRTGDICDNIFFIESGLIRSFYMIDGKEVTNWFMKENDFCIAVLSFLRQIPAFETHVALERCVCFGIKHFELEEIYRLFPEFNKHGRIITGEYYCRSEERQIAIKKQDKKKIYEQLMETSPDLILRVPNLEQLASFLGVSKRTLNKMKKDYLEQKKGASRRRK